MWHILRITIKTLLWLLLLLIVMLVVMVVINFSDKPLAPEAQALLLVNHTPVNDRNNIFVAMVGFNAPESEDIISIGREHIDFINRLSPAFSPTLSPKENTGCHPRTRKILWKTLPQQDTGFLCRINNNENYSLCITQHRLEIKEALANNPVLASRLLYMLTLPAYQNEFSSPSAPLHFPPPSMADIITAHRYLRANAMLDIMDGNIHKGLAFFEKSNRFWRAILKGKSYFLDAMLAERNLLDNTVLINRLLEQPDFYAFEYQIQLQRLLAPLAAEERLMVNTINGEFDFAYSSILSMKRWHSYQEIYAQQERLKENGWAEAFALPHEKHAPTWVVWIINNLMYRIFLQPNDSMNQMAPLYQALRELAAMPKPDYFAQREKTLKAFFQEISFSTDKLYNPTQTIFYIEYQDAYDFTRFFDRVYDLDAYLYLTRMQLAIRLAELSSEEIPVFLAQQNALPENADIREDFLWDAKAQTISFKPYADFPFTATAAVSLPTFDHHH